MRQLNLYNFHKVKPEKGEYEFINDNFDKNNRDKLNLIKRKNKHEVELKRNEIELKAVVNAENEMKHKKLDLEGIKCQTKEIAKKLNVLQRRVETLEGKHHFLEYCHSELGARNQRIKNQLVTLLDKEKTLENLFFYVIRNFFPSLKIIENSLPDHNTNSEQIVDISKNEIITQIYKKIQNYCIRNNHNVNNIETFLSEANRNRLTQLVDTISKKNNKNQEIQNEIKYFSQIKDFQDKYLSDLDDNLNASKLIPVSNTNTFLDKKTGRSNFSDKNEDSSDGQRDLM